MKIDAFIFERFGSKGLPRENIIILIINSYFLCSYAAKIQKHNLEFLKIKMNYFKPTKYIYKKIRKIFIGVIY